MFLNNLYCTSRLFRKSIFRSLKLKVVPKHETWDKISWSACTGDKTKVTIFMHEVAFAEYNHRPVTVGSLSAYRSSKLNSGKLEMPY